MLRNWLIKLFDEVYYDVGECVVVVVGGGVFCVG